jgi:hypothetical protein
MTNLSVAPFWRLQSQRYRLEGARCKACGSLFFPKRSLCLECGGRELETVPLAGLGRVASWTIIRAAPDGFEAPYAIGIIELNEGINLAAQIVGDLSELEIGKPVRAIFRRLRDTEDGMLVYGIKFELVE